VVVVYAALVAALLAFPASSAAQSRRPTGEEWNQVRPLFALVESVAAGEPAPTDVDVSWQCHFVDADAGVVLVPFTLDIRRGAFTSFPVAMYVRVVLRGAPAPAPGPNDALAQYPFEDAAIVEGPINARISRAFTAPPGTYDVYVALTERPSGGTEEPRRTVVKQEVTIPDLKSGLTTSSIIVAEQVEADSNGDRATYEQQLDDPYRLWGARITPATRRMFAERGFRCCFAYQAKRPAMTSRCRSVNAPAPRQRMAASLLPASVQRSSAPRPASNVQPEQRRRHSGGRQIALDTLQAGMPDWKSWSRTDLPRRRYAARTRSLMDTLTRCRLRSLVPPGCPPSS
jgi:hypothetical protein